MWYIKKSGLALGEHFRRQAAFQNAGESKTLSLPAAASSRTPGETKETIRC